MMRASRLIKRPNPNNSVGIDRSIHREDAWTIASFQLKLPVNQVDVALVDECDRIYLGDKCPEIDPKHQAQVWKGIMEKIRREDESGSSRLRTGKRRIRPAIAFAIALCGLLIVAGVCFAAGLLPWKIDISWNEDQFDVEIRNNNILYNLDEKTPILTGLNERLDQMLIKHGFTVALPTWVPEGFVLDDVEELVEPDFYTIISAYFVDGPSFVTIRATKYMVDEDTVVDMSVEKNDDPVDIISRDGVQYYVYGNLTTQNAMSYQQPYAIHVHGSITRDEIMKMIDSIHP